MEPISRALRRLRYVSPGADNALLAPWQFLRAKQFGGDVDRFYLRDDFYHRDTGEALQAKMEPLTRTKPHAWGEPPKPPDIGGGN